MSVMSGKVVADSNHGECLPRPLVTCVPPFMHMDWLKRQAMSILVSIFMHLNRRSSREFIP